MRPDAKTPITPQKLWVDGTAAVPASLPLFALGLATLWRGKRR